MKPFLLILLFVLQASTGLAAPRLALFDFCDLQDKVSSDGTRLALLMLPELSSHPGLDVIERKELNQAIREQRLNASGLTHDHYLLLAKILKADYLVTGRIYPLEGQLVINLKLIDCITGNVSGKSFVFPGDLDNWETVARQLADYLAGRLIPSPPSRSP